MDFKGFYPYPVHTHWCTAMGFDSSNNRIGFTISDNQTKESFKNNENALWVNGKLTPLPPVKITQSAGMESEWVIQDMEGMVDLVFTPDDKIPHRTDQRLFRFLYDCPLGYFNGVVTNSEGEEIPLRNFWGRGEHLLLRI